MNPMAMMQLKGHLDKFQKNHKRVVQFFHAVPEMIEPGSVIEVTVTGADGKSISTNMKVNQDDIEFIQQLKQLK